MTDRSAPTDAVPAKQHSTPHGETSGLDDGDEDRPGPGDTEHPAGQEHAAANIENEPRG